MNIQNSSKIISAALCGLTLMACDDDSTIDSDGVSSSQIFATFEIYSDGGDHVFAESQLTKDIPASSSSDDDIFIRLIDEDRLWFSAGENLDDINLGDDLFSALEQLGRTQSLMTRAARTDARFFGSFIWYNNVWYTGRLPQSADGVYGVALLREEDTDAKYSSVTMPDEFSINSPLSLQSYSRSSDAIEISWAPIQNGITLNLEINSSCIGGEFDSVTLTETSDNGSLTLAPGTLDSPFLVGNCTTTIDVIKTQLGNFDSAFDGGRITAHQIRSVSITTTE